MPVEAQIRDQAFELGVLLADLAEVPSSLSPRPAYLVFQV
jgi:hypothetical protein